MKVDIMFVSFIFGLMSTEVFFTQNVVKVAFLISMGLFWFLGKVIICVSTWKVVNNASSFCTHGQKGCRVTATGGDQLSTLKDGDFWSKNAKW